MNRLILMTVAAVAFIATSTSAGTCLGDWGHFLNYYPKTYFLNPDGRAFTVTLHCMRWPFKDWNAERVPVRVTDPDGKVAFWDDIEIKGTDAIVAVPAGAKGAYLVEIGAKTSSKGKGKTEFEGISCWLESTLERSVVWTGNPKGHVVEGRRLICQASVPRKWWFWVPPGVNAFTVRAQRGDRYMSQREDWGISIYSPRGQRMEVLWGQPVKTPTQEYRQDMERVVEVEPGASGRFWCLELRLGDSHNYSKINVALDGVPPYLARSPEEWFNPEIGQTPAIPIYDDTPFIQAAYEPKDEVRWPNLQHWSPCPSLGDPDGIMVRGDAEFALWNPDARTLRFAICDYCPRAGFGKSAQLPKARVQIIGADDKSFFDEALEVSHYHHGAKPPQPLPGLDGKISRVLISGVERWWAFTYPATPLVWCGAQTDDGWNRFVFEVGTARHWYFHVPRGTNSFSVRARTAHETDILWLEVNAPDRTQALLYEQQGERLVAVPEGLDGKIWHLRTDVGSATRMFTAGPPEGRYLGIYLTLEIKGVPGLLAPTWEQWFDPRQPRLPLERN